MAARAAYFKTRAIAGGQSLAGLETLDTKVTKKVKQEQSDSIFPIIVVEYAPNLGSEVREQVKMAIIYGPVPSWRLGRSLAIDLLSTKVKTCSFNCVYCQLGKTVNSLIERKEFVPISRLLLELKSLKNIEVDYATFSGVGEPTLASNLGQAIRLVKSFLGLPVAVLTNSSLMIRKDVRKELTQADIVVAKLDASNEKLFHAINNPAIGCSLEEIRWGIKKFRSEFDKKLALQMMFIEANKDYASEMAKIAEQISPDEVELNTPLRPCAVKPLTSEDISVIRRSFSKVKNVVTVFEASRPEVTALNIKETHRRRPDTNRLMLN